MRFTRGDVREHIVSRRKQKRPPAIVSAVETIAAVEASYTNGRRL
jgi:hypothetical protein